MYHKLHGELDKFPSQRVIRKYMPDCFRELYPRTRVVIDAKKFAIEVPSSLAGQSASWSDHKNKNTVKVLISITSRLTYLLFLLHSKDLLVTKS